MLHYLPGCDVYKNHREAVSKMKEYMKKQGVLIEKCCRVKENFLRAGVVIVNNCTLCQIILEERYDNNECLSLYEYVLKDENFPWVDHQGEEIVIQDCIDVAPKTMNVLIENDIHLISEEEQIQKMKDWVLQYQAKKVAVYCNGCERGLKLGGGNPVHVIELLAEGL